MNRTTRIGFIVGVLILMTLIVWLFTDGENSSGKKEDRIPFISSNWTKKYQPTDKDPYGLYLFNKLLGAHIDKSKKVKTVYDGSQFDTLVSGNTNKKTFLFVGNNFGLEDREIDTVLEQVEKGSTFLLGFNDLTENLYEKLLKRISFEFDYSAKVNVFTDTGSYVMYNVFQNDTIATDWKTFSLPNHTKIKTLSYFMGLANFIEIPHGDGFILLHSNPIMFVNYQLKRKQGFAYTNFVLERIPENRDVYLLELGRLSDNYGNFDVDEAGEDGKVDDSYFQLIFRTPQFLIALLLTIVGLILFVIFRSKRTRPIVPYVAPKKNMTLAFAETITSIYFAKRNPYGLLHVQRKNFYAMVLKHFFVDLNRRGERSVLTLAEKSNSRTEDLTRLIEKLETKEAFSVSEEYVAKVQSEIHEFYRHTGIITEDTIQRIDKREMKVYRSMWVPIVLILGGLMCIVVGTYYLTAAIGIGIVLWPLGILMVLMGIMRTTNPYLVITDEKFVFYRLPFGKREEEREKLVAIQLLEKGVIFKFIDNQEVKVDYREMGRHDRKQFKLFVTKINTLKL